MITFNKKDYNIDEIFAESKLKNFKTNNLYRLYGLKMSKNPMVLIEFDFDHLSDFNNEDQKLLRLFFRRNGIGVVFRHYDYEPNAEEDIMKVYVGLRIDLREDVLFCAAALQTIIYFMEKRLDLNVNYKIPGIPKFSKVPKKISSQKQLIRH